MDTDGTKAVQVKVPVVATVIQNIEPDGKSSFIVEPPGAEQEQGEPVDFARYCTENRIFHTRDYNHTEEQRWTATKRTIFISSQFYNVNDNDLIHVVSTIFAED